jgi:DNA polymerase III subunit epsilon
MDFLALDFETANDQAISACEIGIAVVRNYKIVEAKSWLIRPPHMDFHAFNSKLHGIKESDVKDERNFKELWTELKLYFADELLVAHNAAFDMHVLRSLLLYYHINFRPMPFTCSIKLSKKVWKNELEKFGLSTMTKFFGIELDHHRAESDAMACAIIASKAFREFQVSIPEEIESKLHILLGSIAQDQLVQPRNKYLQLTQKKFPTKKYRSHWR